MKLLMVFCNYASTHSRLASTLSSLFLYIYNFVIFMMFFFLFRFFEFGVCISSLHCHKILAGLMYSRLEISPAECQSKFKYTVPFRCIWILQARIKLFQSIHLSIFSSVCVHQTFMVFYIWKFC